MVICGINQLNPWSAVYGRPSMVITQTLTIPQSAVGCRPSAVITTTQHPMKSLIAILTSTTLALALAACHDSRQLTPAPETIFDDHGLHVITSFHNNRNRTISVLYGNDEALAHASRERAAHTPGVATPGEATPGEATPGEVFKLVTWDLKQNPLWFGSDINGGLQSVETVTVSASESGPAVDYAIDHVGQKSTEKAVLSNTERISFIFAQRASVFP